VNPQRSQPYSGTHLVFPPTGGANRSSSVRSWATSRSRALDRRGRSWRSYAGDSTLALRATSAKIVSAKSRPTPFCMAVGTYEVPRRRRPAQTGETRPRWRTRGTRPGCSLRGALGGVSSADAGVVGYRDAPPTWGAVAAAGYDVPGRPWAPSQLTTSSTQVGSDRWTMNRCAVSGTSSWLTSQPQCAL
jgi:hypothetical protein